MTPQEFADEFGTLAEANNGVQKLRLLVLELAVQGKLVSQHTSDPSAASTLEIAHKERAAMVAAGALRSEKPLDAIEDDSPTPNGWLRVHIGDVVNCLDHIRKPISKKLRESRMGDVPYYGANGQVGWIDDSLFDEELVLVVEDESFVGRVKPFSYRISGRAWVNNHAHVLQPTSAINVDFLNYALSFYPFADMTSGTTNRQKLTRAGLLNAPLLLPPLAEQHRIVAKVDELMRLCDGLEAVQKQRRGVRLRLNRSSLDRLTSVSSQAEVSAAWQRVCDHFQVLYDTPETLPDLRQTILQLAVQGKLVKQDPRDEPVSETVNKARAKENEPPTKLDGASSDAAEFGVPDCWQWATVKDVAFSRLGKMLDKAKNTGKPQPYLRNTNVHWFRFELDSIKEMLFHDDELSDFEVVPGDLMICEGGHGIARTAVWEGALEHVTFQKALHRVRPFDCVDSYFLAFCLRVYEATGILQRYYTGAGIPHFTGRALAKVVFPLPPLAEQKRIVSKVTDLLSQVTRLESTLTRREATRTQLLTAAIHSMLGGT